VSQIVYPILAGVVLGMVPMLGIGLLLNYWNDKRPLIKDSTAKEFEGEMMSRILMCSWLVSAVLIAIAIAPKFKH